MIRQARLRYNTVSCVHKHVSQSYVRKLIHVSILQYCCYNVNETLILTTCLAHLRSTNLSIARFRYFFLSFLREEQKSRPIPYWRVALQVQALRGKEDPMNIRAVEHQGGDWKSLACCVGCWVRYRASSEMGFTIWWLLIAISCWDKGRCVASVTSGLSFKTGLSAKLPPKVTLISILTSCEG